MGIVSRRMSPLAWNRTACMVAMVDTNETSGEYRLDS
jgi:hypothetical protein